MKRRVSILGIFFLATGGGAVGCGGPASPPPPVDAGVEEPDAGHEADAGVVPDAGEAPRCRTYRADIQPIFDTSCAFAGCHGGAAPSAGLDLGQAAALAALVGTPSTQLPERLRVSPGDPEASHLYAKLGPNPPAGSQMPLGRPPLPSPVVELIGAWIVHGAPAEEEFPPCTSGPMEPLVGVVRVQAPGGNQVDVGGTLTLTATVADPRGRPLAGAQVSWRSADEGVLYVDGAGTVLGIRAGRTAVVAHSGGLDSSPVVIDVVQANVTSPSFRDEVAPLMRGGCTPAGCHDFAAPGGNLRLDTTPEIMFLDVVRRAAGTYPVLSRVAPGQPDRSFLFLKISRSDPPAGRQMPLGAPRLEAAEVGAVLRWIEAGAPQN